MKMKQLAVVGAVVAGLGVAVPAIAQEAGQAQPRQQQPGQPQFGQQQQQQPGIGQQQQQQQQHAQMAQSHRASQLIGRDLKSTQGEEIGEVKEVTFNQLGEIFAVVELEDDKLAAIPLQKLDQATLRGDQDLMVNTTKQAVTSGPTISDDAWGNLNNPQFTRQIYSHYNIQRPQAVGGIGAAQRGVGQEQYQQPGQDQQLRQQQRQQLQQQQREQLQQQQQQQQQPGQPQ